MPRRAAQRNETWAKDFVRDQLAMRRKIRVLTVVDIFSRYLPIIDPRFSYNGEDVVQSLEHAQQSAIRRLFASIKAASSSHATSIFGLTHTA